MNGYTTALRSFFKNKSEIFLRVKKISRTNSIMISVVILTELLVEYTAALAKLTAGILPRRTGDRNAVRIGGFLLPSPSSTTSMIPDFSSHLVDF
jgi:hypothetical protein